MSTAADRTPIRVALAGFGAVGATLAEALGAGVPGVELTAVSARNREGAAERLRARNQTVPVVPLEELEPLADLVVECAPPALLAPSIEPFLRAGKRAIVLSCGALLGHDHLIDLARTHGGQIIVPTGAIVGLDAVTAAAERTIHSVVMTTRKPVRGLLGAPYLRDHGIDITGLTEPMRIFRGTPREAAVGFPENLNVAVALGLAGIGVDRTVLEIWADPSLERNVHSIEVEADSASFSMQIRNVPSENPKTGRITALSVLAALRKMGAPLRVGT